MHTCDSSNFALRHPHSWLVMQSAGHLGLRMQGVLDQLHDHVIVVQVSICPGGVPTGYTYFIPQEEHLESRVVTRAYMEAKMVVAMSGRSA